MNLRQNQTQFVFLLLLATFWSSGSAHAQRPRFDDPFANQGGNFGNGGNIALPRSGSVITTPQNAPQLPRFQPAQQLPRLTASQFPQVAFPPQGQIVGPFNASPNLQPPGAVPTLDLPRPALAIPPRDPSNYNLQSFPVFPNGANTQGGFQVLPPQGLGSNGPPPVIGFPNGNPGGNFNTTLPDARIGQPQFNYGAGQNFGQWPYEGTGSNWLPSIDWTWPREQWRQFQTQFLPRVIERPRFRQTYLHGSNRGAGLGNELDINDIEVATTLTIPNFLQSGQPLRVSPGFIASYWDGPDTPSTGFDLPSKALSVYLAADHVTDLTRTSGFETNLTVGVYSDYQNFSSDSLRLTGRLLGWQRLNEYTVGKLGVEYLDRIRVKLLPAVGVFVSPNPDMKFDLYFPRTKLAHRIPNIGNYEAWTYVGGEYGGGSWAIERASGADDQVDINDVRAFAGIEWIGPRRATGFLDVGYVFNRELVYRSNPMADLELQDTVMVRSGIAF